MIVSGGGNIYPTEIEDVMYSNPRALGVAVLGVPDESWKESVKATGAGHENAAPLRNSRFDFNVEVLLNPIETYLRIDCALLN